MSMSQTLLHTVSRKRVVQPGNRSKTLGVSLNVPQISTRDGRYLLFYFRSDTDIFKPTIVDIDTHTSKLNWSFKLLK